jgi:streptogramin lyase
MRVRTGIPFAIAAIALGACGSNRIVFEADEPSDDAGVTGDVKTPPVQICRAAPYIAEAGIPTSTGQLDMTPFPTGTAPSGVRAPERSGSQPYGGPIVAGPDGNMWFVMAVDRVGRITSDGVFTEFLLPNPTDQADTIVAGRDGNLWFQGSSMGANGQRINLLGRVTSEGCITMFPYQLLNGAQAHGLAADLQGNLWSTADSEIVRYRPTGEIVEYTLPGSHYANYIALGPDGHMWFTDSPEDGATRIVRIDAAR